MERVGRIIGWMDGVATVEVGQRQECVSGSCSDCHAAPRDRWTLTSPWPRPYVIGQRVLVKARRGAFRTLRWITFLLIFCAALAAGETLVPAARTRETAAQRGLILAGLVLGAAGWFAVRAWSRGRPQYRIEALDPAVPNLPQLRPPPSGAGTGGGVRQQTFVRLDEVQRIDAR